MSPRLATIDVTGPDAEAFLLQSGAGYMVRAAGSVIYTSVLNARGTFLSDITAQRIADDHYRLFVGTNAIKRDLAHFTQASAGFDVQLKDTTERYGVLCLCRERGMVVSAIISCLLRHLLRLKARLTAPWTALRGRSTR
ncbi:MAG: hypothetical protein PF480_02700 [Roseovarius sp.]|jgi:glycine cleavage system aminomethyltransferase T|nr:hypothetical protein [Roseovarius sp.]